MYYVVRCDIASGKQEDMDRLMQRVKNFWMAQPGVKGFQVYMDMMEGWPERTMMIEVDDMASSGCSTWTSASNFAKNSWPWPFRRRAR